MADGVTKYGDISQRMQGRWKGEIVKAGEYVKCLEVSAPESKPFQSNMGTVVVFRRYKNYGNLDWTFTTASTSEQASAFAAKHILTEGIAPALDQIVPVDFTANAFQYGMAYGFTDKTYEFHEEDIPKEINEQLGVRKAVLEEMIDFAAMQAGTQVLYAGGLTTRASVNREITMEGLRKVRETMLQNGVPTQYKATSTSQNFGAQPVVAGWPTFCHTNVLSDCQNITTGAGWVGVERGTGQRLHPFHRWWLEDNAIILSANFQPFLGDGAAVVGCGLKATGGYVDVYNTLIVGKGAWGKLNPKTANSMKPSMLMPGQIDKSDPLGQKGVVAMKFWAVSVILRDGYLYRYEHGVKTLVGGY